MTEPRTNSRVNARPEIRASDQTHWSRAAELRDQFHESMRTTLAEEGLEGRVTRSSNGVYPVWARMEAWLPVEDDSPSVDPRIRCSTLVNINVLPFNEHVLTFTAAANDGRQTIQVYNRPQFSTQDVGEWVRFAVGRRSKPSNYKPVADAVATMFLTFIPFARPLHSNRIDRAYRNFLPISLPLIFLLVGGLLAVSGGIDLAQPSWDQSGAGEGMLLIGAVLLGVAILLYKRRRTIISVADRPRIPPRELLLVDSWHAVVPSLGPRIDEVKSRVSARLSEARSNRILVEDEIYGFESPSGYEERERFIVSIGQGVAHVHVYRFGEDVFVGWDSYLNWAKWGETGAVTSKAGAGKITEYRALKERLYIPNQFDLIDLNSLSEVVHRVISDELKALMKESKIDQEIDFQIIRGDRDNALDRERFDRNVKDRKKKPFGGASPRLANWRID